MIGKRKMDIQELLTSVLVKYIVFMIAYMAITYFVYNRRYTKGRREVKKYYGNLKKLTQLYEREAKLKMSENKDWEKSLNAARGQENQE